MAVRLSGHPLVQHKLTRLRDVGTPPPVFRQLVQEIAMMLAVEATRELPLASTVVTTPLTTMSDAPVCRTQISLVPILRAGLGMLPGALALLPDANTWLIGLERDEESLEPRAYYRKITSPQTTDLCLVLDPMLATGGSLCAALATLKEEGVRNLRYLGLVAAPEGIAAVERSHPDTDLHIGALDERLTGDADDLPNGYIWPGLGDAGDRQFRTG